MSDSSEKAAMAPAHVFHWQVRALQPNPEVPAGRWHAVGSQ